MPQEQANSFPYKELIDAIVNPPAAYETSGLPFWDDAHISKSMLAAHLEPDADGASRKHAFMDNSANWIVSLIGKQGGKILDLGCGPGLYAKRFADRGFCVTGVDFSSRSIAYAKEHCEGEGHAFIYRDYLTIDYDSLYDAAVLIYCDFGVQPPENRKALLKKVYRSLKPGGLFIVDAHTARQYEAFADSLSVEYSNSGFWRAEPYLCIRRSAAYPSRNYLEQYTIVTAGGSSTYNIWNHGFEPQEIKDDLLDAGFALVTLYGDAAGAKLTEESLTVCAVCRK